MGNIKKLLLGLLMVGVIGGVIVQPVLAADNACDDPAIPEDIKNAAGCTETTRAETVVNNVLKVVTGLLAVLAIGVMIFGGFMYVTSTGEAQKAYRARHIIIYGLVGLVVSLLASAIVHFVGQGLRG